MFTPTPNFSLSIPVGMLVRELQVEPVQGLLESKEYLYLMIMCKTYFEKYWVTTYIGMAADIRDQCYKILRERCHSELQKIS